MLLQTKKQSQRIQKLIDIILKIQKIKVIQNLFIKTLPKISKI